MVSDGQSAFAVVRTGDSDVDASRVAKAIAEPLGRTVADLLPKLAQQAGIFAERLPEPVAHQCVGLLSKAGIGARVVPQSAILGPPEIVTLSCARPDESAFSYTAPKREGAVKWTDVLWIDFVSIPELSTEVSEETVVRTTVRSYGFGFPSVGAEIDRVKKRRSVTKIPLFIDVVSHEPWLLLRIPQDDFEFATTGLPVFPSRRENLIALAASIASRANEARLGPGLKWMDSGAPPREHRLARRARYDGFLRWELTRLFLE
jgi:hypothetical protein